MMKGYPSNPVRGWLFSFAVTAVLLIVAACVSDQASDPDSVASEDSIRLDGMRLSGDSTAYSNCVAQATSNVEFAECGDAELARQEAAITIAWTAARQHAASLGTGDPELEQYRKALEDEQSAWLAFRDKACQPWLHGRGREGQVIHYAGCQIATVTARVEYLRSLVEPLGP